MLDMREINELESWRTGSTLVNEVFVATRTTSFDCDGSLKDDIRNACRMIMSNMVEGFTRDRDEGSVTCLRTARAFSGEVRFQLYAAYNRSYINQDAYERLDRLALDTGRHLADLVSTLDRYSI